MAERLQILGPCAWWTERVRSARYAADGRDSVSAAVVFGPEVDDEEALDRWRERGARWIGRPVDGALTLLGIERIGRRTAWVYEDCDGVSMGATFATAIAPLPLRVGAQVVAACAEVLEPLAATGRVHPGIDLDDVLLRADGSVLLAGFVGPFAQAPMHREPRGAEDASAVVWRLGVLLSEVLTGVRPTPATDRVAHDLMLRRLLIRIMSRPGPMFPERYRDWLCGMLAWESEERPLLSRVAPGLREIASTLPSPDLAIWAAKRVPELRGRARAAEPLGMSDPPLDPGTTDITASGIADRTEEALLPDAPEVDDVTAISAEGDPPRRFFVSPERGTIPVHVGPPAEAVQKPARLPDELFRTQEQTLTERMEEAGDRGWRNMAVVAAILVVVAVLLSWYLWN